MLLITNEIQKHQSIISKTPLCHPHQKQIHFNDYSQFAIYKPKIYIPIFFPDILQIDCSGWDPTGAVWDIYNTLCNSSPLKHSLKPQKSIILAVICLLSDQYQKKKRKHEKLDLIEKIHSAGGKCGENARFLRSVISFYGFSVDFQIAQSDFE